MAFMRDKDGVRLDAISVASAVVDPNDVGFDVILLAGQSNMVGQGVGLDTTYLDVTDPRIWQLAGSGTYAGQVILAMDPLLHRNANAVGHAMTYARRYIRELPPNRRVLLVPAACSGTGFTTSSNPTPPAPYRYYNGSGAGTWDPTPTDGGYSLYENAIAQANTAIASDPKNRLVAILWHQGEADGGTLTGPQYAAKLDALIAGFRSRITGAANVPFILGQMLPEGAGGGSASTIHNVHVDTPRRNVRTAFAYGPSGMSNGDGAHYNAAGQRVLGQAVFDAKALALANVLGTPPVAPTGVSLVQSGTSAVVTWTRTAGRVTDYLVEYKTGASWTALTRAQSLDKTATVTGLTLGSTVQVRVSTVNEQGTSAPAPAASLSLANLLAAPTGLTSGAVGARTVPLSWSAVSGSTGYQVQYKLSTDTTWTTFGSPTGTSVTVTGLAPSSGYDFRVSSLNIAGASTPSSVVSATTTASTMLLSAMGVTSYGAYALRKTNTSYAGAAIKVRRDSDNTTQDVGFVGEDLDSASLLSFVGSGSGYIDTWYDQSGGARHLTAASNAAQARVVSAGTQDKSGGKPTAVFSGSQYYTGASVGLWAAGAATMLAIAAQSTPGASGARGLFGEGSAAGSSAKYVLTYTGASNGAIWQVNDDAGTAVTTNGTGTLFATTAQQQLSVVDTGAALTTFGNGTQQQSSTYTRTGRTLTLARTVLGGIYNTGATNSGWVGSIAEIVTFSSALTPTQRQAGEANEKAYYTTP